MNACIVGVGEPTRGDDAVGLRVVERLRELSPEPGVSLHALRDPSELPTLLDGRERALVVDALLDPDHVGHVVLRDPESLRSAAPRATSSHGVDTLMALELGRVLLGASFPRVRVLTISIPRPLRLGTELTPEVERALDEAVAVAREWAKSRAFDA